MDSAQPAWQQAFSQIVVSNCRYWLDCAQNDMSTVLREIPQVLRGLSYSLHLSEAWEPTRELMLRLSPLLIRQGQGSLWESCLASGIARSAEEQDPTEIELRLQLGNLYRLQGRLPEARSCLEQALNLCRQYESRTHYWSLLNQLGLVARLSARPKEALAYCQQVLAEQSPNSERAEALNVMGLVAHDRRQWEEALNYFDQALALYRSLDRTYQMARIFNNRGLVLLQSGRLDEAGESYQQAIQHFQRLDDLTERFKSVMNLGNVFLMKKDYEAAIQQYQQALPIFKESGYLIDLANVYNNLGMASAGLADWDSAEAYYLASLEIARNLSDSYALANTLDNYGKMLMKAEQPRQAVEVLHEALEALAAAPDSPAKSRLQGFIEGRLAQLEDE